MDSESGSEDDVYALFGDRVIVAAADPMPSAPFALAKIAHDRDDRCVAVAVPAAKKKGCGSYHISQMTVNIHWVVSVLV